MTARNLRNAALGLMFAGLAAVSMASAKTSGTPVPDDRLAGKVLHEIRMYPRYSIFDDVKFQVSNGTVALLGEVNQPYKKSDLGNIISHVDGVVAVDNELKVAPLSDFDDHIRMQVANAIYRDPTLYRYGFGTLPSIHIIVDNGHVTLEGVVETKAAKDIAGIRAGSSMSFGTVTNNLQVAQPDSSKSGKRS